MLNMWSTKSSAALVLLLLHSSCGAGQTGNLYPLNDGTQNIETREDLNGVKKDLPAEKCDPWDPTIVPRSPTVSSNVEGDDDGASPDPGSRKYSSMATARPRRLHHTFLQYQILLSRVPEPLASFPEGAMETIMNSFDPMHDSWITSSVPINIPKYTPRYPVRNIALSMPETNEDGQLSNMYRYRSYVNYGDNHPFEGAQIITGVTYQPLRIVFHTVSLPMTPATISKVEALTGDILPSVLGIWAAALSVVRAVDNIFVASNGKCGEADIPPMHSVEGVSNADMLIYVTANGHQCYNDDGTTAGVDSYATVCTFDQHMRPVSGNLVICLDQIEASPGEIADVEFLRVTSSLTLEVGKILGLSPSLFVYFRDPKTGKSWGAEKRTVKCVDGTEHTLSVPNMLQSNLDLDNGMRAIEIEPYFEVISPTVKQVVRNHFDCQSLRGARLDGSPRPKEHSSHKSTSSCFGDSFDLRYHYDEDMTPMGASADMAYSLSPLTLALLEDSSWYKADFSKSTMPLFGRGAGCGFMEGDCVTEFNGVPEYSRGFFCNDIFRETSVVNQQPSSCDYTHNHKANCDSLIGVSEFDKKSVFQDDSKSPTSCSMRTSSIVSCIDKTNSPALQGEVFSDNSRCFETNVPKSVCLETYCNSIDSKIDIIVDGNVHQCDYEGHEVDLDLGYSVKCPRLAIVCPHLICPANCSGKGVCDYCREIPRCVCDDRFDETPGCWGDFMSVL